MEKEKVEVKKLGLMALIDEKSLTDETKIVLTALDEKMADVIDNYIDNNFSEKGLKDQMEDVKKSVETELKGKVSENELKALKKEVNEKLLRLKSITERGSDGRVIVKSIKQQIIDQLKAKGIDPDDPQFRGLKGKENGPFYRAAQKSADGMFFNFMLAVNKKELPITTDDLPARAIPTTVEWDSSTYRPDRTLRDLANVTTTNTPAITIIELGNVTGEAAWVPEGGLKPMMDAQATDRIIKAGKVALGTKISEEVQSDVPRFVGELRSEIFNRIKAAEVEGIMFGTGADGQIVGVWTDIPEFSLTGISVQNPNIFDAIVASYTQIISVKGMNFRPNAILMNPVDIANMKLAKNANDTYLFPTFTLPNGEIIPGLIAVPEPEMAVGSFVMGDFQYLNIRDYEVLNFRVGWVNDDFQRNLLTIIGEERLMAYIKNQYLPAFIKGEYATIEEAIAAA